ncbi:MAG: hypothetical protein Q4A74_09120 [Cardiobacteriaceae bacterium]|nr:hypothetical protein [Cardiobacteriaceae bacterium]
MVKTIREFATEFSIEIKQVQNKVAYIRRKKKKFGELNKSGIYEFSFDEIQYLKEAFNITEKTTEVSIDFIYLKNQIKEKDKQISLLQQALNQQQILTKQVQDQNNNLLLENQGAKKELFEERNKNFFQRLFKL